MRENNIGRVLNLIRKFSYSLSALKSIDFVSKRFLHKVILWLKSRIDHVDQFKGVKLLISTHWVLTLEVFQRWKNITALCFSHLQLQWQSV